MGWLSMRTGSRIASKSVPWLDSSQLDSATFFL